MSVSVQTRRGCPYKCEFCLVTQMFGRKVRYRKIDNIIEELEALPIKKVIFVDDNFITNKKYTLELLSRIKPLGLSWICQASLNIGHDEELLKAMADAGCIYIVLGFESVNPESLQETNKLQNTVNEYKETIHRIHKLGMMTYGSFIVGFDHDTLDEFENILNFTIEAELPYAMISLLGATPGTELFTRISEDGRWVDANRNYSGGMFPVLHYNNFSQKDLFVGYVKTMGNLYSFKTIYERTISLLKKGYFTRENKSDPPSLGLKINTTILVLREFVFTKDEYKKKFFLEIWKLIRQKKLSMDTAVPLLLAMLGMHLHAAKLKSNINEYLALIDKVDKGPWKDQLKAKQQSVA